MTLIIAATAGPATSGQTDSTGPATFLVLVRGTRVGTQSVAVSRSGSGWLVSGTGRLAPPVDLVTNKFEVSYGSDWQPQQLTVQGSLRGQPLAIAATFGLTTASTDVVQGLQHGSLSHQMAPRSVILSGNFFGGYEVLALRLETATPGTRVPAYLAPDGEVSITVDRITPRRVSIGTTTLELREFLLTVNVPGGTMPLELWVDSRSRLARLVMPASSLVVLREDLATVMAREEHVRSAGDEDVFIPANGFSLGGTLSKPSNAAPRLPAVILVSSPGPQDRDLTVFGVSIFGQLANALADAGFAVVRYDGRGVGRSGGRTENAALAEYAEDVLHVVGWLRKRRDIDPERIAVVGYSEGAPVALTAAGREKRIKGVVLVAAPGRTGREVTLEQQQHVLSRLNIPESEKASRTSLQTRIIDAAVTGNWEGMPRELRDQADSPWFKGWLLFDPATAIAKLEQPLLLVHGTVDREIPAAHSERLETLARARRKAPEAATRRVLVTGVNHLLIPADTGEVDEYATLPDRNLSRDLVASIATWLRALAPAR
ncbi:MAG: alpha/beta fold hydrolase [Vicinamibacterales bacterium]